MKAYEECLPATSTDHAPGTSFPPTTRKMLGSLFPDCHRYADAVRDVRIVEGLE